jgi:hypothetical protein
MQYTRVWLNIALALDLLNQLPDGQSTDNRYRAICILNHIFDF